MWTRRRSLESSWLRKLRSYAKRSCSSLSICPIKGTKRPASGVALSSLEPRHGGITRLRSSCRSWPWSIQAVTRYIQQKAPGPVFTSFAILYDQEAKPHRDSGNEATPNVVIKLSDFQGGGLWIEDPLGQDPQDIDGRTIPGTNTECDQDTIVFNAKEALHMTLPAANFARDSGSSCDDT